jgi:hypothetical protein
VRQGRSAAVARGHRSGAPENQEKLLALHVDVYARTGIPYADRDVIVLPQHLVSGREGSDPKSARDVSPWTSALRSRWAGSGHPGHTDSQENRFA